MKFRNLTTAFSRFFKAKPMISRSLAVLCACMLLVVPTASSASPMKFSMKFSGSNDSGEVSGVFKGIDGNRDGMIDSDDPADTIVELSTSGTLFDFVPEDPCSAPGCKINDLFFSYSLGEPADFGGTYFGGGSVKTDLSFVSLYLSYGPQHAAFDKNSAAIDDIVNGRYLLTETREIPISYTVIPVPAAIWFLISSIGALFGFARSSLIPRNRTVL